MIQTFWSEDARKFLEECGRHDVLDRGDALAERVSALIMTALSRLDQYVKEGDLYCGRGGTNLLEEPEALAKMEEFVNTRLRSEIDVLEKLLEVFDDLRTRKAPASVEQTEGALPAWY